MDVTGSGTGVFQQRTVQDGGDRRHGECGGAVPDDCAEGAD